MKTVFVIVSCLFVLASTFTPDDYYEDNDQSVRCGPNEVEYCVKRCPPERSCKNRGILFRCRDDQQPCTKKCVCAEGYYRNAIGDCITGKQCDKCQKDNEFYSCNSACDNECINIHSQNRTNCPIVNLTCNERCYCEDGYARDKEGNCVPVSECKTPCSDPNEEYIDTRSCPPDSCFSVAAFYNCDVNEVSQFRCRCKPGYLREKDGPCIPICQCPQVKNSPDCARS